MNKAFRVSLIAIIAALAISALSTPVFGGGSNYENFMLVLGLVLLAGGIILAFAALIVYVSDLKDWVKPLLFASSICFVIGTGVCGSLFLGM